MPVYDFQYTDDAGHVAVGHVAAADGAVALDAARKYVLEAEARARQLTAVDLRRRKRLFRLRTVTGPDGRLIFPPEKAGHFF